MVISASMRDAIVFVIVAAAMVGITLVPAGRNTVKRLMRPYDGIRTGLSATATAAR